MTTPGGSDMHTAAYLALCEAEKGRANAESGWRPHVLMVHPDGEQVIEFYSYDEAVAWLRSHLIDLEDIPEDQRPVR